MCAINDPLGQTHNSANFQKKVALYCEILKSGGTDVQKPSVKIVIISCRASGSASWINLFKCGFFSPNTRT